MPCVRPNEPERGAAMIIFMAIILMGGLSMAVEALLIKSKRVRSDQKANYAMVEAKRALLAYAALDAGVRTNFGNLPCPNSTGLLSAYESVSVETSPCGNNDGRMVIGFLPWQSMRLPPLVDGENAPLLYAVSGAFKVGSGQTMPYTCNATDNLTINGSGNFAAIVISPGEVLPLLPPATDQSRPLGSNASVVRDQFLEEQNAIASEINPPPIDFQVSRIMTSEEGGVAVPPFNDRLLGITCAEVIRAINQLPL